MTALQSTLARHVLVMLLALVPTIALAQDTAPALPAWEQLSPAQREQLIAPIRERWNAEPAHRGRMLAHAQRWRELSPEQRRRAHRGMKRWEGMSPEQHEQMRAVFSHIRPLPRPAQKEFLAKWRAMSPEQKRSWVLANPAPARREAPHR